MGGKGRKRREKNYIAAHGAPNRLPPPPAPSSIDALPSKLRKLMSFAHSDTVKLSVDTAQKNSNGAEKQKKAGLEHKSDLKTSEVKKKENGAESVIDVDSADKSSEVEKKKKKRKRKEVDDLRFEAELLGSGSKKKKKKKNHREKIKLKRKGKVDKDEYPGYEDIKFGEVVKAPPKLVGIPMRSKLKPVHNASAERMRIQAVEAYRERRRWTSRPGLNLPPPDIPSTSI